MAKTQDVWLNAFICNETRKVSKASFVPNAIFARQVFSLKMPPKPKMASTTSKKRLFNSNR